MILGDFNCILNSAGRTFDDSVSVRAFANLVFHLGFSGPAFTWIGMADLDSNQIRPFDILLALILQL